jgi:hypothetical protein
MSRAAAAPEIGPRVDVAKRHQRLQRPRKMVKRAEILRVVDYYPPAGPAFAKPAGDLIQLGGLVLPDARKTRTRDRWITASYLVAITVAMIGWLWLIAWMAMWLV